MNEDNPRRDHQMTKELEKFLRHTDYCRIHSAEAVCNCGLALALLRAAEAPPQEKLQKELDSAKMLLSATQLTLERLWNLFDNYAIPRFPLEATKARVQRMYLAWNVYGADESLEPLPALPAPSVPHQDAPPPETGGWYNAGRRAELKGLQRWLDDWMRGGHTPTIPDVRAYINARLARPAVGTPETERGTGETLWGRHPVVSLPGNADCGLSWAENNAPDGLRMNSEAVLFARRAFNAGHALASLAASPEKNK